MQCIPVDSLGFECILKQITRMGIFIMLKSQEYQRIAFTIISIISIGLIKKIFIFPNIIVNIVLGSQIFCCLYRVSGKK